MDHPTEPVGSPTATPPKWSPFPRRYSLAILAFFGCFCTYALRVDLSVAIVDMTANRTVVHQNDTTSHFQEFEWDSKEQGLLLSSFFYGYISTQCLGGWLALRIGGAKLFASGILFDALLGLLAPPVARCGFVPLMVIRILGGAAQGLVYPALYCLWGRWAPPLERTKLLAISIAGRDIGALVTMSVSGYLTQLYGWASTFYTFGAFAILWCGVWLSLVRECPKDDPYIRQEECDYIDRCLGPVTNQQRVPWRALLTSLPVWATVVAKMCENWGFYLLLTQLPQFLSDVSGFDIGRTGSLAAIPYMATAFTTLCSGCLVDFTRSKWHISTTLVRKIFTCVPLMIQCVAMVATAYTSNIAADVTFLTIAIGFAGAVMADIGANDIDIAPPFASVIMGFVETIGVLPGIIAPTLTGYIVQHKLKSEWLVVFDIAAGFNLFGCVFYGIFASAKRQSWSLPISEDIELESAKV